MRDSADKADMRDPSPIVYRTASAGGGLDSLAGRGAEGGTLGSGIGTGTGTPVKGMEAATPPGQGGGPGAKKRKLEEQTQEGAARQYIIIR